MRGRGRMDWNKAKTILIIAFIVLDVFLIGQVIQRGRTSGEVVDERQVIEALNQAGIFVEGDIPKEETRKPLLEVTYQVLDGRSQVVVDFLGENYYEVIEDQFFAGQDGRSVEIIEGKKMVLMERSLETGGEIDLNQINQWVEVFTKTQGIDLKGYERQLVEMGQVVEVTYVSHQLGTPIVNDYYKFYLDHQGVAGVEIQSIKEMRETQAEIRMTQAVEALLRLLRFPELSGDTITDIRVCYYRDEQTLNWQTIVTDNLEPVWQVTFKSGRVKYLIEAE